MRDIGRFMLGLLLTALAGWVDAVGFLDFGGLYTSFMSGNTIQIGVGVALVDPSHLVRPGLAIGGFMLGVIVGGVISAGPRRWTFPAILLLHAGALSLAVWIVVAIAPSVPFVFLPLAFAMGLQNHLAAKRGPDNAGTSFITGTLFRLGDAVAQALCGMGRWGTALRLLGVAAVFVLGAGGGAAGALHFGANALAVPAGIAVLIAVSALTAAVARAIAELRRAPGRRQQAEGETMSGI